MSQAMHLVMFDIDGTLTATNAADTDCYVRAVCETLRLKTIDSDWHHYRHVTDSGILAEIIERTRGRSPSAEETARVCDRFVELLSEAFAAFPCEAIAGAGAMLHQLGSREDVTIALATGGWERSARLKLDRARIDVSGIALASADDARPREQIMQIARDRAAKVRGVESFESFTYVGDGLWDLQASERLSIPFIGIGCGERAARLRAGGATWILPDYAEPLRFLAALSEGW